MYDNVVDDDIRVTPESAVDPLVLALDVGTSSVRAIVYDSRGRMIKGWEIHEAYTVETTVDGGVFVNADHLVDVVVRCIDSVLERMRPSPALAAVSCSMFWHSLVGVHEHRAVTPVYTWADTRSGEAARQLSTRVDRSAIHRRTGAALHSSYLPAKLLWLSQTQPQLVAEVTHWMSFAEYVYLAFFGERRVSLSMASGSGLFDQKSCKWDEELLDVLGIREEQLSPPAEFSEFMQNPRSEYSRRWPELRNIPWYLPLGDGACSNIGCGGIDDRKMVAMIGTSGALRVVREEPEITIPDGVWTYRVDGRRFVQGGAFSDGGNVFAWVSETLRLDPGRDLEEKLSRMVPDCHGLTILPFLAGERSPNWNPDARAAVVGMRLDTSPLDTARAWLEAVAYRFGDVFQILKQVIPGGQGLIASGAGLLKSPTWMQILADVLGEPLAASAIPEASSRGAALLVLETLRALPSLSVVPFPVGIEYQSNRDYSAVYRSAMARQDDLYRRLFDKDPISVAKRD